MKITRIFLLFPFVLLLMSFHEYFMSFAELDYNEESNRLEVSISVTGHDLEEYMKEKDMEIVGLESCSTDPISMKKLAQVINNGFQLFLDEEKLQLDLVGLAVNTKDEATFYLISREIDRPAKLKVRYDLLMNYFIKQQNKLTVFTGNKKEFYAFLKHKPERIIEL